MKKSAKISKWTVESFRKRFKVTQNNSWNIFSSNLSMGAIADSVCQAANVGFVFSLSNETDLQCWE
ncbi:hypothetical protein TYRP_017847 [Tyrophagus putrescentiae]|nr:hypothetical protein TYRP_017847 [Tyrophagus putrescentiae]